MCWMQPLAHNTPIHVVYMNLIHIPILYAFLSHTSPSHIHPPLTYIPLSSTVLHRLEVMVEELLAYVPHAPPHRVRFTGTPHDRAFQDFVTQGGGADGGGFAHDPQVCVLVHMDGQHMDDD